jgi:hypothetical protein
MNNQQIQTPGVSFLLASQDKSKPYRLRPELWDLKDRGPAWFFENKVQPFVDQGVTDIFLHRMFGETAADGPQDFDTWAKMLEAGGEAEQYVQMMLIALFRFFQRTGDQPFVYLGSFQSDTLSAMDEDQKWRERCDECVLFVGRRVVLEISVHILDTISRAWLIAYVNTYTSVSRVRPRLSHDSRCLIQSEIGHDATDFLTTLLNFFLL